VTSLRVISYNLHDFGKPDRYLPSVEDETTRQLEQIGLLKRLAPDVLCVQEIWWQPRLGQLGQEWDATDVEAFGRLGLALGMDGFFVPAPHSHCHMAIFCRPDLHAGRHRQYQWNLWHGAGSLDLDIPSTVDNRGDNGPGSNGRCVENRSAEEHGVLLRVAVTHLGPWDPEYRFGEARQVAGQFAKPGIPTVIAADRNCLGEDLAYDPEPDWTLLPPEEREYHIMWRTDPTEPPRADRRPSQLLHRAGLTDAACHLRVPWQPTAGHRPGDLPRRIDGFWLTATALPALRDYRVHDSPEARRLSDHLPVEIELDLDKLPPRDNPAADPPSGNTAAATPPREHR
jgi:endonuclease/exonuclease/phosphatase family metal-dependent hydrolase